MAERDPAQNTPSEARLAIQAQIRATSGSDKVEDLLKDIRWSSERFYEGGAGRLEVRVGGEVIQRLGDVGGRENKINGASEDGAARHARLLGRQFLLRKRNASFSLDGFYSQGSD